MEESPHQLKNYSPPLPLPCYNPIKISFLVVVIAHEPFLFSLHALCKHAMLVLILIDVQYSHNVVFSLENDLNGQNCSSSGSHRPIKKNLSQQNFPFTPYWGRLPPPPYCYLQNHVLTPFKQKYHTRGHFRLKLSPTSRCCPWWLIFFKNLFYQKNFKDTIIIGGGQIRGPLFNFFVVKKCTFLHLPDPALSS